MRLKEARKRAGLTAREVALALGVSPQNVYSWEAGSYFPRAAQLKRLGSLYGVTVDDLLDDTEVNREGRRKSGRTAN